MVCGILYRMSYFPKKEGLEHIMQLWELFVIAVGLSMDAFAVSICKGLSVEKLRPHHSLVVGAWFGGFQALMPLVGYLLGTGFAQKIQSIDHWVAFVLLGLIGANMVKEALGDKAEDDEKEAVEHSGFGVKSMFPMAVATSIDALAVGVSFAFLQVQIVPAVTFIGVITFVLSAVGVVIGNIFGAKYKSKAELVGGIVLIVMGIKILVEHLIG